jgi:gliding motility-associated-like protein
MDSTLCAGDTFKVPFTLNTGTVINPGNIYTVYLSDPSGNFTGGGTVIGTLAGTGNGTVTCVVPMNIQPSADYRVRIMSSNTVDSSDPNIHKIAIGIRPTDAKAKADMPVCEGDAIHLYASSSVPGVKYSWTGPSGFTSTKGDNNIPDALASKHNGKYIMKAYSYTCVSWDSVTLDIRKYPEGLQASAVSPICVKNPITLISSTTTPGTKFTWTGPCNFTSNDSISRIDYATMCNGGKYTVVADRDGCKKTTTIDMKIIDAVVDLGPDEVMCMNEIRVLKLENANATYTWHNGSTASEFTVTKPGIYWVTANTECGILRDTVIKEYEICECKPFVPTAFTPNGDGLNDKLGLTYIDCKPAKLEFLVVNRFGEAVFKTTDPTKKWDGMYKGEPAEVGTYFFQLKITGPRNKEYFFKGDVALIR